MVADNARGSGARSQHRKVATEAHSEALAAWGGILNYPIGRGRLRAVSARTNRVLHAQLSIFYASLEMYNLE